VVVAVAGRWSRPSRTSYTCATCTRERAPKRTSPPTPMTSGIGTSRRPSSSPCWRPRCRRPEAGHPQSARRPRKRSTSARANHQRPPMRCTGTGERCSRASRRSECAVVRRSGATSSALNHKASDGSGAAVAFGACSTPSPERLMTSRRGAIIRSTSAQTASTAIEATSSHGTGPPLEACRGGCQPRCRSASTTWRCQSSCTSARTVSPGGSPRTRLMARPLSLSASLRAKEPNTTTLTGEALMLRGSSPRSRRTVPRASARALTARAATVSGTNLNIADGGDISTLGEAEFDQGRQDPGRMCDAHAR
jgi:hypothetical protein